MHTYVHTYIINMHLKWVNLCERTLRSTNWYLNVRSILYFEWEYIDSWLLSDEKWETVHFCFMCNSQFPVPHSRSQHAEDAAHKENQMHCEPKININLIPPHLEDCTDQGLWDWTDHTIGSYAVLINSIFTNTCSYFICLFSHKEFTSKMVF